MKATHAERENWRTAGTNSESWYNKLSETEQFVIRFTVIVAVVFAVAYVVANIDVLETVRVINDFAANIITEVISIGITVLIIERLNQRSAMRQKKEELILQMGSPDNGFALEAVRKLRYRGWIRDGSLKDANVTYANLKTANLTGANLQNTVLWDTNLEEASLLRADFQEASLLGTNLQGANLQYANLLNAVAVDRADFSTETTLPNGDKWHEGYDLSVFTDPDHPNFWEPAWVKQQHEELTHADKNNSE